MTPNKLVGTITNIDKSAEEPFKKYLSFKKMAVISQRIPEDLSRTRQIRWMNNNLNRFLNT